MDVSLSILQECPRHFDGSDDDDLHIVDKGICKDLKKLIVKGNGVGGKVAGPSTAQEFLPLLQDQLVDGFLVFQIKVCPL